MYFLKNFLGAVAFAVTAAAQSQSLYFTDAPTNVEVGSIQVLQYVAPDMSAPVTITLEKGPAGAYMDVSVLTSDATGGFYNWNPDPNLVSDTDYGLKIMQGSEVNYWGPIVLNAFNEPGASSVVVPQPTFSTLPLSSSLAPPAPTSIISISTVSVVTSTPYPMPTIVPPPTNTSVPPPFPGSASNIAVPLSGIAVLIGAFAFFL